MRKVLVTGGAGFVGRHLIHRLLERGDDVHCVDIIAPQTGGIHPSRGWPFFEPRDYSNFHFYHEDCRDFFKRIMDSDFDYCFPLAAIVGGRLIIENNPLAVAEDLSIDAAYWKWAAQTRPKKTVGFSSSAVYPISFQTQDGYVLLKEEMVGFNGQFGMPDMSYGWAKLTGEYLARLGYQKYGLLSAVFRPFSGYGEDQDDSYPFPSICKRVLQNKGEKSITVWGSGKQMRDFIHIDDCMDGIFTIADKINDGSAVNLSTGIYTSFIDFAKLTAKCCGYYPEVCGISEKPEGVFARAGDVAKQHQLGFYGSIPLRKGIERALTYYTDLFGKA